MTLDPEIQAFLEKTASYYPSSGEPPSGQAMTLEEERACYDRMCAAFHQPHPFNVESKDDRLPLEGRSLRIRRYRRKSDEGPATVIYYHGGGFILGGLESHDDVCAEICATTGHRVVSVDYRLAPEFPFPHCFNDALEAFQTLADEEDRPLLVAGDSAGGNLAAAVSLATRGQELAPIGQVLIYPGLGGPRDSGSFVTQAFAPGLTARDCAYYYKMRSAGADHSSDPRFAPLSAKNFDFLPPAVIFSAELDPLCDDGELYAKKLKSAGIPVGWFFEEGLVHGYLRARKMSKRAGDSFTRICKAIGRLGYGESIN